MPDESGAPTTAPLVRGLTLEDWQTAAFIGGAMYIVLASCASRIVRAAYLRRGWRELENGAHLPVDATMAPLKGLEAQAQKRWEL